MLFCCVCVCVFAAYLADFGWCKNHVEDSRPASKHSCGDCVGQRYHQEPQVTKGDKSTLEIQDSTNKKKSYKLIVCVLILPKT